MRKHEGRIGPKGDCRDMSKRQCDRARHCMRNNRNVCVPNLLAELLGNDEMKEN